MIIKKGNFDFKEQQKKFVKFQRQMPKIIAEEAKNHFVAGFRKGGGQTDKSLSGWKARKPARTTREAQRSEGRAILVKSGNMRADIMARTISFRKIVINVIHIPYAIFHNEGEGKLPQREFIGDSRALEAKIARLVDQEISKVTP